ncbi:hypothetical protein COV16_04895 [Candidatus Woesearchaeota archaeon CG10_big_fil_rev_8_21_14_0_10_34_8]|nr:MAG: hypothetical protein COV16_04895 [Candidatus Woesearchaeota archaeon CG10_big_fil_rev_8_21_14_0_10_34_8]
MSKLKTYAVQLLISSAGALVALALVLSGAPAEKNLGGTPGNLPTRVSTSSQLALVADTVLEVFTSTTTANTCSGRTITTGGSPLMVGFGNSSNPVNNGTSTVTGVNGVYQAASTTALYPAEDYGCLPVAVYPYANDIINVAVYK